ncbi:TraB/GumN family protein [Novosphingobium sp. ERN07]|uniref:TraB/GumN family protein n=1 Tax=Novosphingobium sp. ERN07 TaxID=2726187 RepID=UPI0014563C27|nr:TraB/GumN family protein [Novosphingobium sp. ERN07]NLR71517.1 TraB/GumN family protein [Novosphingobium sp. ERN07]
MKHALRTLVSAVALVGFAFTGPLNARAPAAKPAAAAPAPAPKAIKPALWKVSDEDTTIYLFGTIHALPKGLVWLDGPVATALDASSELLTEIPEVPPAQQQKAVMAIGLLQGETLRSLMGDADREAYEALLARLKIPPQAFDALEPWLAGITLGVMPYAMAGYTQADGVEAVLRKAALAKGKSLGALETVDYQLGLFDQLPRETQLRFLNQAVRDFDRGTGLIGVMTEEWGSGDPDGIGKLLNENMDDPGLAESLLYQRNRNWAAWVRQRLQQPGTVFVAVGAGHLAGPGSVQDALKAQGVETARVQ